MSKLMKMYLGKLIIRIIIFLIILLTYIFNKEMLESLIFIPIWKNISVYHIIWLFFMVMMILHLCPTRKWITMAIKKTSRQLFLEIKDDILKTLTDVKKIKLLETVQEQDYKALIVLVIWCVFNGIFGLLYHFKIIDASFLLLLTCFYFVCDYICILFFCPFQRFIMKNKCCVNCRIFDWGHFMMFTPMIFIPSFFSWSLFFMSLIVMLRWEIIYRTRTVMFYQHTNSSLQCNNCKDKLCGIKKKKSSKIIDYLFFKTKQLVN